MVKNFLIVQPDRIFTAVSKQRYMKKVSKTAKSILVQPLARLIANMKYERYLKKMEKAQEELLLGYDSPLLYAK